MDYLTFRQIRDKHGLSYQTINNRSFKRNIPIHQVGTAKLIHLDHIPELLKRTERVKQTPPLGHPLRDRWINMMSRRVCCREWKDFETFVRDVSPPTGRRLHRRHRDALFSRTNFRWI